MGLRNTFDAVEVLAQPSGARLRNTFDAVEVLATPVGARMRTTFDVVEVFVRNIVPVHDLSDYLKDALVNHIFRSTTLDKPLELWIGLFTDQPGPGNAGAECAGNGYARAQLNPGEVNWNAPSSGDGATSNGADIVFPAPTGSWGSVLAAGVFDASAGGNLLAYATLTTPADVGLGDAPTIVAGALTVTFA